MTKYIVKNLIKATITLCVVFSVCEVANLHEKVEEKTIAAAVPSQGQYIPPNLDYSEMIKDIKRQEGIFDDSTEALTANKATDDDMTAGMSPSQYLTNARELVKAAIITEDEQERRYKVKKAFKFYKEYLKYDEISLEAMLGAGNSATFLGKEEEAKNYLMEAYATYPKNPLVHKALGDYSFKFGNYNNAIEYYNLSLLSGNLKDYSTNVATAVCYEKLGDIENAIAYFKVAQHLNPESEIANLRLEMYEEMQTEGYQSDSRAYAETTRNDEGNDVELKTLMMEAMKIK